MNIFKTYKKTIAISLLLCLATSQLSAFDLKSFYGLFTKTSKKTTNINAAKSFIKKPIISKKAIIAIGATISGACFFAAYLIAAKKRTFDSGNINHGGSGGTNNSNNNKEFELLQACKSGNLEKAKKLIADGADVNKSDEYEDTPIKVAYKSNHPEIVRLLANPENKNNKANLETQYYGATLLHMACEKNKLEMAKILIESGADLNPKLNNCETPLDLAFLSRLDNNSELIELLLNHNAPLNFYTYNDILEWAIKENKQEIIQILENKKINLDVDAAALTGETKLYSALKNKKTDLAKSLIKMGANVNKTNYKGETLLFIACNNDEIETAQALIDNGADVNQADYNGTTPFSDAIYWLQINKNKLRVLEFLLKNGANVNQLDARGRTPLNKAFSEYGLNNNAELIELLLKHDAIFGYGIYQTPEDSENDLLDWAIKENKQEIIKILIAKKRAKLNRKTYDRTTLINAIIAGNIETIKILISNGANVNMADLRGVTPIHAACMNRNLQVAQILADLGADVNQANNNGDTPLIWACKNLAKDIIDFLINDKNIEINKADRNGKTPLDFVEECSSFMFGFYNKDEIIKTLKIHGAKNGTINQDENDNSSGNQNFYNNSFFGLDPAIEKLINDAKKLPNNAYSILKINNNANKAVIEKAYRKYCQIYHPDINKKYPKSICEKFIQDGSTAKELLLDKKAREEYDKLLKSGKIKEEVKPEEDDEMPGLEEIVQPKKEDDDMPDLE